MLPEDLVRDTYGALAWEAVLAPAARAPRIHDDAVADLDVGHVGADLGDVPRRVAAEDMRERQLEGRDSFADRQIQMVQGCRVDADHHLVRSRDRIRMMPVQLENLGPRSEEHTSELQSQ